MIFSTHGQPQSDAISLVSFSVLLVVFPLLISVTFNCLEVAPGRIFHSVRTGLLHVCHISFLRNNGILQHSSTNAPLAFTKSPSYKPAVAISNRRQIATEHGLPSSNISKSNVQNGLPQANYTKSAQAHDFISWQSMELLSCTLKKY